MSERLREADWIEWDGEASDPMPPRHENVWCRNRNGIEFEGCICYGMHIPFFTFPRGWKNASDTAPDWIDVTHWRPLRAALDAEPEPSPSDEEAAALTIAYVLTYCAGKPGQPSEAVSVGDVPERFPRPLYWVTRSYAAARTEGYAEGAEAMREGCAQEIERLRRVLSAELSRAARAICTLPIPSPEGDPQ